MQVGFGLTGRTCTVPGCGGALADNILDWDSKLPDDELEASEHHARNAVSNITIVIITTIIVIIVSSSSSRSEVWYCSLPYLYHSQHAVPLAVVYW